MKATRVIISCEHGGKEIPAPFRRYFEGKQYILNSHLGYDIGAKELYDVLQPLADYSRINNVSRYLIELNRSPYHPILFSPVSRQFSKEIKGELLRTIYLPYREDIESIIQKWQQEKYIILHLSVHTFTPELNGNVRNADIGLLYDPSRSAEKAFCKRWQQQLNKQDPSLRIRMNYPYLGKADGFITYLRTRIDKDTYMGIELEVNQKYPVEQKRVWESLQVVIRETLQLAIKAYFSS